MMDQLILSCKGLSPSALCRFIPALSQIQVDTLCVAKNGNHKNFKRKDITLKVTTDIIHFYKIMIPVMSTSHEWCFVKYCTQDII